MSSFKLYAVSNNYSHLLTDFSTDHDTPHYNLFSTFDEKIDKAENDQITLTFSIVKYVDGNFAHWDNGTSRVENKLVSLLPIGGKLRLVENDLDEYVLIIKSVAPAIKHDNVIYTYTCQDEVSYKWAKRNLGFSYSTNEEGGVKNIYDITKDILKKCNIYGWIVAYDALYNGVITSTPLVEQKITFEIENSNPYNAIIEACAAVNANLTVDYKLRQLSFYQKDRRPFSGYRYHPERNMKSLSVTYDGNNMATLLHVKGGTDEYEQLVSMLPAIPSGLQRYLLTKDEKDDPINDPTGWWPNNIITDKAPTWSLIEDPTNDDESLLTWSKLLNLNQNEYFQKGEGEIAFTDEEDKEYAKYLEFCKIATKVPHLGQFLCDFSYFDNEKASAYDRRKIQELNNIFNIKMRNNNVMLKLYTEQYYKDIWELNKTLYDTEATLELVFSQYADALDKARTQDNPDIDKIINTANLNIQQDLQTYSTLINSSVLKDCFVRLYGQTTLKTNDKYNIEEFQALEKTIHSLEKRRDEAKQKIEYIGNILIKKDVSTTTGTNPDYILKSSSQDKQNTYDFGHKYTTTKTMLTNPDDINLMSEYEYYWSVYNSCLTMCGEKNEEQKETGKFSIGVDGNQYQFTSLYYKLLQDLENVYKNSSSGTTLSKGSKFYVEYFTQLNNELWNTIYLNYGDYIYEAEYENSDELNSISLYNQAAIYYETLNHPSASFSVDVLSIGELERVQQPLPRAGYRIKVYSEALNLADGRVNDFQRKQDGNDLVITQISYDLRKPSAAKITVEQVTQYQSILQKLIKSVK